MKTTLKLEEAGKLIFAYLVTLQMGFQWWVFLAWLIAPDISLLAYVIGTRTGALVYNLFHHQGIAIAIGLAGWFLQNVELQFTGVLFFGHSSMDRVVGYGLKYPDAFGNTHLGWVGAKPVAAGPL